MKILGIGNAIVDVLCRVDDEFLHKNSLTKSTMKLIDEIEFKKLLSAVNIEETISGGSVANSIVGLSSVVHRDIKEGVIALGNPARPMKNNENQRVFG